jgi:transcriptional regulator with XRE-family HTH domain
MQGTFRDRLEAELSARKAKNARYSIRAFAAFLGADHSSLAQMLRGARPIPAAQVRAWAKKLGFPADEAAVFVAAEHVSDTARALQLRHWTAEALAVMNERAHFEILRLTREPDFRADVRWIARESDSTVDQINTALARLLRLGLIEMGAQWKDLTGLKQITEAAVRKLALERVRQAAAANGIKLIAERKTKHG